MPRKVKVYGWTGTKYSPGSRQSRNIIAATSIAEALRLSGTKRAEYTWSGAETRNIDEVAAAMANPGVMLWRPLDNRDAQWTPEPKEDNQ